MRGLFKDMDVSVIKQVMDINFFGAVACQVCYLHISTRLLLASSIAGYRGRAAPGILPANLPSGLFGMHKNRIEDDDVHVMWVAPDLLLQNTGSCAER